MDINKKLDGLLAQEDGWVRSVQKSTASKKLSSTRAEMLESVNAIAATCNLKNIVAMEKAILENDLVRYANSKAMKSSLQSAINEMNVIQKNLDIVVDVKRYKAVDEAYSLPKNRQKGLPIDEARQAFKSHYARLLNLDKSRLGDDEKKIIDARKSAVFAAGKLYTEHQAQTLGLGLGT